MRNQEETQSKGKKLMLSKRNGHRVYLLLFLLLACGRSGWSQQQIEQEFEFTGTLENSILEFDVEPFDNQGNTRQLVGVTLEYDGMIDLGVLIQNYTTLDLEAGEWAYDAGANMIVAFDDKPGFPNGGPFFGLGGIYEAGITGELSAGSGGPPPPFGSPTPGDVTLTAEVGYSFFSEVSTTTGLTYFIGDEPLKAKIAPFQDFIVTPPEGEPNGFIDGTATFLDFSGDLVLTYEWLEGTTRPEDCNGDGELNFADLDCACSALAAVDDVLFELNLPKGDLDGDGNVAFSDFLILSEGFNDEGGYAEGDLDCDGEVTFSDFLILSFNFGRTTEEIAAVPEPGSWTVLLGLLGVVGLFRCQLQGMS